MMRVGIPEYRLPRNVLDGEIDEIRKVGVEIKTNTTVESVDQLFKEGFDSVFFAIGAHQGLKMGISGEEEAGVMDCISFLRDVNLGTEVRVEDRVGVIGGGNAAIDAARTALRLGAKEVTIVYRRTRAEMPASAEEIDEALNEGVNMIFLAAPSRIFSDNGTLRAECLRMQLGQVDASGRPRPEPIEGSEFVLDFGTVILAIGQRPDVPDSFGLATGRGNVLQVDPDTLATEREGVFAGGDATTGPATVIEAIAAGRQAAVSIDRYLGGNGVIDEVLAPLEEVVAPPAADEEERHRPAMASLPLEQRLKGFAQVELGFSESMAIEEAKRCLNCDLEE